jgi:hypothetical protein
MARSTWTKPLNDIIGAATSYYNGHPFSKPSTSTYQHISNPTYAAHNVPLIPNPTPHLSPEQHQLSYHSPCLSTYSSSSYPPKPPCTSRTLTRHHKTLARLKKYLKITITISLFISTVLTLFMEISMIYMVSKLLSTRDHPPSYPIQTADGYERTSPWAKDSVVWPTYLLLTASGITCFLCVSRLIADRCGSVAAKYKKMFSLSYDIFHVVAWVGVSVLYRVFKTERDLWGWTCSREAERVQGAFEGVVAFEGLCSLQVRTVIP